MENFGGTVTVSPGKLFENCNLCVDNFQMKWNIINFPGGTIALRNIHDEQHLHKTLRTSAFAERLARKLRILFLKSLVRPKDGGLET